MIKPFKFACSSCGKAYAVRQPSEQIGRRMRCRSCGAVSVIAAPNTAAATPSSAAARVAPTAGVAKPSLRERPATVELEQMPGTMVLTASPNAQTLVLSAMPDTSIRSILDSLPEIDHLLEGATGAIHPAVPRPGAANVAASAPAAPAPARSATPAKPKPTVLTTPPSTAVSNTEDLLARLLAEAEPLPIATVSSEPSRPPITAARPRT